ncbi:MAG: amidohydrolase family protein [Nitrospinota bacterium]
MADPVIDLHFHCMSREADQVAQAHRAHPGTHHASITAAPASQAVSKKKAEEEWNRKLFEPAAALAEMDRLGIDVAVLSPPPYGYYHWVTDGGVALRLCEMVNGYIADLAARHPGRFRGYAIVPLQVGGEEAAGVLERAVRELKLVGAAIASNINGRNLDEDDFEPFWKKAGELGCLIFIHPTDVAGHERIQRYYLTNLIGNPLDTTIAAAHLIFKGIFERHPGLQVLLAHAGGHLPYIRGRLDHGWEYRPEVKPRIPHPPSYYFKNLYFDILTFYSRTLEFLVSTMGEDHVVFGTDFPFDMMEMDPVRFVMGANLKGEAKRKVSSQNAARLVGLG